MSAEDEWGRSRTSRIFHASREAVYRAFLDPVALAEWQAPVGMRAEVYRFDARVGGGYEMSLFYRSDDQQSAGKTAANEDRFTSRFVELSRPSRIVQVIAFDTDDPSMSGDMTMTITLEERGGGTEVTIAFEDTPVGIRPEDNDAGTRSSLEKLARYVEAA